MRDTFCQAEGAAGAVRTVAGVDLRGPQDEVRAVGRDRRVIARQREGRPGRELQGISEFHAGHEADELMETIRAPAGDGQREVELRMRGGGEHAGRMVAAPRGGEAI